ncbi:MAG: beta-galactosidase [Candidatus Omnitrophica bacterium]|nr:beta-galactosidase [Candidatus Omnitrophota bacterium]
MPQVEIKQNTVRIGKKTIPLVSGEVHYWRLNPHYWAQILDRVKEMGINVVATYVAWDYHEYQRGKFDFTGRTDETRNLKHFLELTREKGFWVIIRPGPYIYSEWPNEGVPAYAYKYHRLHPQFLAYAKKYMAEVTKIIRPFLATKTKGHVILLQADNEIDPWPDIFGNQYGLNGKPGIFQKFIRELYGNNLKKLNQDWGTRYRNFNEVAPFIATMFKEETGLALKGDKELKRNIDYFRFKYYYSLECAKWNVETYKSLGIDIPIYLNLYPFFYAHDWLQMQSVADLVGIDLYPSSELAEDEFEQRKLIDKVRYLRSVSRIPYIAEFAAGVWHARHYESGVLTPNHYRLITLSALLGGICGWNWYMLVNRDNWYMSPINEWGRTRPELYSVFQELVHVFKQMDPPSLEKLTDVAVTINPIQYAARTLTHNSAILVALYNADVDYELFDPRLGVPHTKILFYSGNQWLDRQVQKNLRSYVEKGGILVAFRNFPRKDEEFQPSDLIGFHEPSRILFEFKRKFDVQLAPNRPKISVVSSVFSFDHVAGKKIEAQLGPYGKHTIGYRKKIGKGELIHLGFEPTAEVILELLHYLKIPLYAYSPTREVKTALFCRGDKKKCYLVAVNNGNEEKSALVHIPYLRGKGRLVVRDLFTREKESLSSDRAVKFTVSLSRKDGRVFEFKRVS